MDKFYLSKEWKKKRIEVLKMDKYECQNCKKKGRLTKANTVHHLFYRKKYPAYELETFVIHEGKYKRNLISLCHECHEEEHDYRRKKKPITEERW